MKKIFAIILSALMLLSACEESDTSNKKKTTTTVTITTSITTTSTPEPEIPEIEYTLLDGKNTINAENNLIDCEIEGLDDYIMPKFSYFKDYIVISECPFDEEYGEITSITLVSLADGKVKVQKEFPDWGYSDINVSDGYIIVNSYNTEECYLLDENLDVCKTYDLKDLYQGLILFNSNKLECYSIIHNSGVYKYDFEKETIETIVSSPYITVNSVSDYYCYFSSTNPDTFINDNYLLDCTNGKLETNDIKTSGYILKSNDLVIYTDTNNNDTTFIEYKDKISKFNNSQSLIRIVKGSENFVIFTTNEESSLNTITLYGPDGKYISSFCDNFEEYSVSEYCYYSKEYDGYFLFLNTDNETTKTKLVFWDTSVKTDGKDLRLEEVDDEEEYVADVSPKIRNKINDIESKFGVEIKVADECNSEAAGYTLVQDLNEDSIYNKLLTLERNMNKYPDGFFKQIKYGDIEKIEIQLLYDFISPETVQMSAAAFVYPYVDTMYVYFGTSNLMDFEVYHEFTHVIDFYLSFQAEIDDTTLFDDNVWCSYNPENFEYAETGNDSDMQYLNDNYFVEGYFTEAYSCANSMEDRATLMTQAMMESSLSISSQPLTDKLTYWCECIRDGFDTTGWPEITLWEKVLYN